MKIILKSLSGQKTEIDIDNDMSILDVKEKLKHDMNRSNDKIQLIFKGHRLEDTETMKSIGIVPNDSIIFLFSKTPVNEPVYEPQPEIIPVEPTLIPEPVVQESNENSIQSINRNGLVTLIFTDQVFSEYVVNLGNKTIEEIHDSLLEHQNYTKQLMKVIPPISNILDSLPNEHEKQKFIDNVSTDDRALSNLSRIIKTNLSVQLQHSDYLSQQRLESLLMQQMNNQISDQLNDQDRDNIQQIVEITQMDQHEVTQIYIASGKDVNNTINMLLG